MPTRRTKRSAAGFSFVELLVVLVISGLLLIAVYSFFIGQNRVYAIQTEVSGMQQDARAGLMFVLRDVRMAGFGVGTSGFDVSGYTQAVHVVNNVGQPDQITIVCACDEVSTVQSVSGTQVTLADATHGLDTSVKKFVAFETVNGVYEITNVASDIVTLNSAPPTFLENFNAKVFLVKAVTYEIDTTRHTLDRVDSLVTPPGAGADPDDLWDDLAAYVQDFQIEYPYNGSDNMIRITLTSSCTDYEGTTRSRVHEAVTKIRNMGI